MISISLKISNMALVSASPQKCWDFFLTALSVVFSPEASCELAARSWSMRHQAVCRELCHCENSDGTAQCDKDVYTCTIM